MKTQIKHLITSGILLAGSTASAATFDWGTVGWAPDGSLNQSYANVDNSDINVTVTVSENTDRFRHSTPLLDDHNGGLAHKHLKLDADFADSDENVTVTFQFSTPVKLSGLRWKDVDYSNGGDVGSGYDDKILVYAKSGGTTIYPNAQTLGSAIENNTQASYESNDVQGYNPEDSEATVTVDFSETYVTELTYVYSNGDTQPSGMDPDEQVIWFDDFTFTAQDSDGDGVADFKDLDDDNDGIPDTVEGDVDTDGDGIPNRLDLDSDNDGITDLIESGQNQGTVDTDNNGILDSTTDGDGDGLMESADADDTDASSAGSVTPIDTDGDGYKDFIDIDADDDGIVDNIESQTTADYVAPTGSDTDEDGLDNAYDTDNSGTALVPVNTDGDDQPDYQDTNSDNADESDAVEGWDTNNDGTADTTAGGNDVDHDGLDDAYDQDTTQINPTNGQTAADFPDLDNPGGDRDWREAIDYAPVAADDSATVNEDSSNNAIDVTHNDNFGGDGAGTNAITITSNPSHGSASANDNGTPNDPTDDFIVYTPSADYHGSDSLVYRIEDSDGDTDTATVTITVNSINDAPVAHDDSANTNEDTAVEINVPSNDTDDTGLDLTTVTVTANPTNGSTSVNATTGKITYTPNAGYHGTDTFKYTIKDSDGVVSNEATVTVNVARVNDAPVAHDDSANTNEDTAVEIDVPSNDTDDAGLDLTTVTVTANPTNGAISVNATTGKITYTPNANFHGTDTFKYTIKDSDGVVSNEATVTVDVASVDDAPLAHDDSITVNEDSSDNAINVTSNDDFGGDGAGTNAITITSNPSHGTASVDDHGTTNNPTDDTILYTPSAGYNGSDSLTYQIKDSDGDTSTATVAITVSAVNDTPDAVNDSDSTNEDTAVSITVLGNDSDPDGDALSVTGASDPAHGSTTVNGDNTITYTPDANFNGTDTFTYDISDGHGGTDTATVTITVNAVADAPDAVNDSSSTTEDTAVSITVLDNDSDPDGDTLSVTGASDPAHGSTTVNGDNTITYTPDANFNGTDTFTYTISDGNGGTDTATVTVTVGASNDTPDAVNDSDSTNEDTAVSITVLTNDSDPDGDTLSVTAAGDPAHGSTTVNGDNTITYTPDANFNGTDTFTYTISDGHGGTDTATVTVTVNAVDDAPVAVDDNVSTNEDTPVVIDVPANDTDVDGTVDLTTVTITEQPTHGTLSTDAATGKVTYTPAAEYHGTDSFHYTIKDNGGTVSNAATVTVTINSVNDTPDAVNDNANATEDGNVTISVLDNDSDNDGDTLTVTGASDPVHGTATVNADGTITYVPDANFNGTDTFTYDISDGNGGTDTATVIVVVEGVNDLPTAVHDHTMTSENTAVSITPLHNDTDPDEDILTVTGASDPAHGNAVVNADDTITYTPDDGFTGTDTFTYDISDGNGGTDTATVTVRVTEPGDTNIVAVFYIDENHNGTHDKNEAPVINATVELLNDQGQVIAEQTTDETGRYAFNNIPIGHYHIRFTLPEEMQKKGYVLGAEENGATSLTVDADTTSNPNVTLSVDAAIACGCNNIVSDSVDSFNPTAAFIMLFMVLLLSMFHTKEGDITPQG